jgi:hypothetical protein
MHTLTSPNSYADNAKHIVNKAVVNEGASAKIIRELKGQIETLKRAVAEHVEHDTAASRSSSDESGIAHELAEAQALLSQHAMSFEERLEATRREMGQLLKSANAEKIAAEYRAAKLIKGNTLMKSKVAGLKWRAQAHIHMMEQKLAAQSQKEKEGGAAAEPSPAEKEAKLEEERRRALELQQHLDELNHMTKLDVEAMTECVLMLEPSTNALHCARARAHTHMHTHTHTHTHTHRT